MSNGNHLITYKANGDQEIKLSPSIVRNYLVSGNPEAVTDQEVTMFLQLCRYQRLNPFLREAYLIKYGNEPATIVTGKTVFEKRAAKNELFNGMESGIYVVGKDEEIKTRTGSMKLPGETIVGGWAKVHRKDWEIPVEVSVSLEEYVGRKKNGEVNRQWASKPGTMIVKVAETQALRKAFPDDFEGLYDAAEFGHDHDLPSEPVQPRDVTEEDEEPEEDRFEARKSELVKKLNDYEKDEKITMEQLRVGADYIKAAPNLDALEKAWKRLEASIIGEKKEEQPREAEAQEEASQAEEPEQEGLF